MFQEEGYWEGNVYTCLRKKNIGKEMITNVSGRRILGRKRLHRFQEEGYWEGNDYTCLRKMRKKTHYCESDLYYLIIPKLAY